MTHSHPASAHSHAHQGAEAHAPSRPRRASALTLSAADRLLVVGAVSALLWAGVYWALH